MGLKKMLKIASGVMLMVSLCACGENSNSNGTLSLSASGTPNAGVVTIDAIAVVTPSMAGTQVSFSAKMFGYNAATGQLETVEISDSLSTNSKGSVTWTKNLAQKSFATTLQVTAVAGGISQTAPSIAIPAL